MQYVSKIILWALATSIKRYLPLLRCNKMMCCCRWSKKLRKKNIYIWSFHRFDQNRIAGESTVIIFASLEGADYDYIVAQCCWVKLVDQIILVNIILLCQFIVQCIILYDSSMSITSQVKYNNCRADNQICI